MVIVIEITHSLPANHQNAGPITIVLKEESERATESWSIHLRERLATPVIELLQEHNIEFTLSPDGSRLYGDRPLPAIVIGSLPRLRYTFRP